MRDRAGQRLETGCRRRRSRRRHGSTWSQRFALRRTQLGADQRHHRADHDDRAQPEVRRM